MSQANLDHNVKFCFFEIYVNIIAHSIPLSIKLYFSTITAGIFSRLTSFMRFFCVYGQKILHQNFKSQDIKSGTEEDKCLKVRDTSRDQNVSCVFLSAPCLVYTKYYVPLPQLELSRGGWEIHLTKFIIRPSYITAVNFRGQVRTFRRSLFSPSCPKGGSGMFLQNVGNNLRN